MKFSGELGVWIDGSLATTLQLKHRRIDLPIRVFDLRIKFGASLLPQRCEHISTDLQWHHGQFIIAKAEHGWKTKDGRHMPVVSLYQVSIWKAPFEILSMCLTVVWVSLRLLGACMLYSYVVLAYLFILGPLLVCAALAIPFASVLTPIVGFPCMYSPCYPLRFEEARAGHEHCIPTPRPELAHMVLWQDQGYTRIMEGLCWDHSRCLCRRYHDWREQNAVLGLLCHRRNGLPPHGRHEDTLMQVALNEVAPDRE